MPPKKEAAPSPLQNKPTGASEQEPMVKVPDNEVFGDTPAIIKEGLAAMDKAAGKTPAEPDPEDVKAPEEVAKPAKTEAPEPEGPSAKGWAAVKKAEAKLRQERERFDEDRKTGVHQLNQMKAEIEQLKRQTQTQQTDIRSEFQKDAFGTLKKHFGVTLNDLAQMALSDQVAPPQQASADEPERKMLVEKLDRLEKLVQMKDQRDQVNEYRAGIRQAMASEQFEILQTLPNAEQEVFQVAADYVKKTGELLPPEKAAGILAKYWEDHLSKVGSHKAARRVLGLPDPEESGANGKPAPRPKGPKKTLTNQMSSPSPVSREIPDNLTDDQILREAVKLIPEDAWDRMG